MNFKIHPAKYGVKSEYLEFISEQTAYVKNGKNIYYKCKENTCLASGKLVDGHFVRVLKNGVAIEHNHPNHALFLEVLATKHVMKEQSATTSKPIEDIFETVIAR
jgi:hypothetical protein